MIYWFTFLFWSICLEGLGRKYLPGVPGVAFYLLKDAVLFFGYLRFPPSKFVQKTAKVLYGGFQPFWIGAFGWTVIEIFNPDHRSLALGFLGLRAYWVWWLAPVMVASVLQNPRVKRQAMYVLLFTAVGISLLGIVQFGSSPTSSVNLYTVQNGEEIYADTATVAATGRARVSSTFSFLSGFVAFTLLVPTLLLSIGMGTQDKTLRKYALGATLLSASVLPMSGSRGALLLGAAILIVTAWTAGLFFTRVGRRVMLGAVVGAVLSATAFPEALEGVVARFENREESTSRLMETFEFIPFVAMADYDYPIAGIGTGMQQNARFSMGVSADYNSEGESGRYLIELGPFGYLMFWVAKIGLVVALVRAYTILKKAGRRAAAGAALSYTVAAMIGSLTFDHIWQALFFLGCGFILAEVVAVLRAQEPLPRVEELPVRRALAPFGART